MIRTLLGAAALSLAGGVAVAQTAPSLASVAADFEARGYVIEDIERDDDVFEIEATGADGVEIEVEVAAATGETLHERRRD